LTAQEQIDGTVGGERLVETLEVHRSRQLQHGGQRPGVDGDDAVDRRALHRLGVARREHRADGGEIG
jgi:hypothetical protein